MLNKAAAVAVNFQDQRVGPGQYLYVSLRSEGITFWDTNGEAVSRAAKFIDTWIPADPRDTWVERRGEIGEPSWVPGHEGDGPPPGEPAGLVGEWRAPCGAFGYWAEDSKPSCDNGSWVNPTQEFLAGLPQDPEQLYQRLVADSGSEADAVITVGDVLGTGQVRDFIIDQDTGEFIGYREVLSEEEHGVPPARSARSSRRPPPSSTRPAPSNT